MNNIERIIEYICKKYKENAQEIVDYICLLNTSLDYLYDAINDDIYSLNKAKNTVGAKQIQPYLEDISATQNKLTEIRKCFLKNEEFSNDNISDNQEETFIDEAEEKPYIDYTDEALNADTQMPHTVYENFTYTKPIAVEIENVRIEANEWKYIFVKVCEFLYHKDNKLFTSFLYDDSMRGRTCKYFSDNPKELRRYILVKGSNIYVECNLSANHIRNIIIKLLEKYNISKQYCKFYIRRDLSPIHNEDNNSVDETENTETITETVIDADKQVVFGKQANSFHLPYNLTASIFEYILELSKSSECISVSDIKDKFSDELKKLYDYPMYAVGQIVQKLIDLKVLELYTGYKRKKYQVINTTRLRKLIYKPEIVETEKWNVALPDEANIQFKTKVRIHVLDKKQLKKRCPNCSNEFISSNEEYFVYNTKGDIETTKKIHTKKCPNCNKLYITEGQYVSIQKQQSDYIDRTNLEFIR